MGTATSFPVTHSVSLLGWVQGGVAASALGLLLLAPPVSGQIALYPLSHAAERDLPGLMLEDGRRLVARTSFGDGYVVEGRRPDVTDLLFEYGILALAVPDSGCLGDPNAH